MTEIARGAVIEQLKRWQVNELDAEAVWQWALQACESGTPADEAVRDVMDVLVEIPQDLIVQEDAQVMIEALSNPLEELTESQNLIWNYFDFLDTEGRKRALADDPLYAPYCDAL